MKYPSLVFNQRDGLVYGLKTDHRLPETVPLGTVKNDKLERRKNSCTKDDT